jgi:hypothetical protein
MAASSTTPLETPILFVVFNRPSPTSRVFSAIKRAKPTRLYVCADGPRVNSPNDQRLCQSVREILADIDWECQVSERFNETNKGCRENIRSALDWFFSLEDRGIILEDDCLASASFFPFCSALLERYESDERVMHVSGVNYLIDPVLGEHDYYFSRLAGVTGWATWARSWQLNRHGYINFEDEFLEQGRIFDFFSNREMGKWMLSYLTEDQNGRADVWSSQWAYTIIRNNGLTINPSVNLVEHIGTDADATHRMPDHARAIYKAMGHHDLDNLRHPKLILPNQMLDDQAFELIRKLDPRLHQHSLQKKIKRRLSALSKKLTLE